MTAPTSDERREVAARLRDWADRYPQGDFTWGVLGSVHYRIDGVDTRPSSNQEVLYMLADLIDPTCEVVGTTLQTWSDGSRAFYHELSCGHTCETVWAKPPAFCNECGARVVERGEADGRVHR